MMKVKKSGSWKVLQLVTSPEKVLMFLSRWFWKINWTRASVAVHLWSSFCLLLFGEVIELNCMSSLMFRKVIAVSVCDGDQVYSISYYWLYKTQYGTTIVPAFLAQVPEKCRLFQTYEWELWLNTYIAILSVFQNMRGCHQNCDIALEFGVVFQYYAFSVVGCMIEWHPSW